MKRGDLCWASLPDPTGSGPGFHRPVVVVQSNPFNESRISTVIVTVATSNLALAGAPSNFCLGKADSGLTKPSVVNVSQIITLDRQLLAERVKPLPAQCIVRINEGLRLVLGV